MGKIYRNGVPYMSDANTVSVEMSYAEYMQLTPVEKNNGTFYYITDEDPFIPDVARHGFTPIGTIIALMGTTAPLNYLACNGQTVNILDYPELAQYFKDQFGSINKFGGDGTTFAVPDLRGEFLRGTGTNSHANQGSGAAVGTHQDGTLHPNVYLGTNLAGYPNASSSERDFDVLGPAVKYKTATSSDGASNITLKTYTSRPTNTAVLYCIAYKNIYTSISENILFDATGTERMVGWYKYANGTKKPVYQKTVDIGALPNNTEKLVAHNIANIDFVVSMCGTSKSSATGNTINIPYPSFTNDNVQYGVQLVVNATNIKISTRIDFSASSGYVTLQYTKTSDTAI